MVLSVSDRCRSCIITLQEVVSILSQPDQSENRVSISQVCAELDRFSLFVGNIGALHRPESPLSIESRLQDAGDVLTHIVDILTDLNDVTAELLDIVSRKREGRVSVADEAEEEAEEISEVNELLEEISETITRLFRVSILIRQAAPTDVFAKALSRNRYRFDDQFDIAHVGEKYCKLATENYTWLRQRLGRAITERRHYLSYVQDHREKLGGILNQHKAESSAAKSQAPVNRQPLNSKPMLDAESRPSFFTKATTIAAEHITPRLQVAEDSDLEDDARSYTTVTRSIDENHDSSTNIRIPKLDTLRVGHQNEFECPFCFRIKKFKSERIWRKHVFSDLRPYVCTFPNCDAPYFGDINKWFQHEMKIHRVKYHCFLCQKIYYQEKKYISHLRQEHAETLHNGGEQVGIDLARKPLAQIPASDCPCCSDWAERLEERIIQTNGSMPTGILAVTPTVFKRHLAAHLEQLALFAVPIGASTDDNESSNAAIEEARSKRTNASRLSTLTFSSLRGSPEDADPDEEPSSSTNEFSGHLPRDIETYISQRPSLPPSLASNRSEMGDHDEVDHSDTSNASSRQERFIKNVLDADITRLGREHPDTIASMMNLAELYSSQERLEEAGELFAQVMEATKRTLGDDDLDTIAAMKKLALNFESQERWGEAGELLEQVVEITKTKLGEDHVDTLNNMGTLASIYITQKRLDEAEVILKRISHAYEETVGGNDVRTLASKVALATVLEKQGKLDEAQGWLRGVLLQYEEAHGHEDKRTLSTMEHLARVLEKLGDLSEAELLSKEALAGNERAFGLDSVETIMSMQRLAFVLEKLEKFGEAEPLRRKSLAQCEKKYGSDNTHTIHCVEMLASVLRDQGKSEEEEPLCREALERYKRVLGQNDPNTLSALDSLAAVLDDLGNHEEAEMLYRELLTRYNDTLGPDHPDTISAAYDLALVLRTQKKLSEAKDLHEKALIAREKMYGHDHPKTESCMSALAAVLEDQGKLEEAEELRRNVMNINYRADRLSDVGLCSSSMALATVEEKQGKLEAAEMTLKDALMRYSSIPRHARGWGQLELMHQLSEVLEKRGEVEEAEDLRRQAQGVEGEIKVERALARERARERERERENQRLADESD